MKKLLVSALPFVIAWSYVNPVRSATVDPVIFWNGVAATALAAAISPAPPGTPAPIPAPRPPQVGALDLAMVHVAIHDAVQAYEQRFEQYAGNFVEVAGSPQAAVAAAAHDVLMNLYASYPWVTATVDATYTQYLTDNGLDGDPGVAAGEQAATNIITLRLNDGRFAPLPPFVGGTAPGEWRPTESFNPGPPPSFAPMAVEWLAYVVPFTLTSPSQFRASPPPALTSTEYARAYDEVKALGSLTSASRTPEQTDLGYFYADNFILLLNRMVSAIAAQHVDNLGDAARLFALVFLAVSDAGITAWDSKRHYAMWRPLTAIREGDNDTNSRTVGDPDWKPLINTPNYPTYTSGANNVTAAAAKTLSLFFKGDKMTFTVHSNYPLAVQTDRTYTHFSDLMKDVVDVRILQGIHFRFDDEAARRQGQDVAKWVYQHVLRPLHGQDDSGGEADSQSDENE
jgi:hypothetical protein